MYDPITERLIREIPKFENVDVERLPQFLSSVYSNVIAAKSQMEAGRLSLIEIDDKSCIKTLNTLILGLEALMTQPQYKDNMESLAFVTATAYSLRSMLCQRQDIVRVSMDYISSNVCATLLFVIADEITDAIEVSQKIKTENIIEGQLVEMIRWLVRGRLDKIADTDLMQPKFENDFQNFAIQLLFYQLNLEIKDIAAYFSGDVENLSMERIKRVLSLSSFRLGIFDQIDTYFGVSKIADLLLMAIEKLHSSSIMTIPTPKSVDRERWLRFLKARCKSGKPFLWRNHGKAIHSHFLDNGVSSVFTYPTGAGKSTVVQLKIGAALLSGRDVIVLVPTHALESQMQTELSQIFDGAVKHTLFLGGEFSCYEENAERIMVMTPERCLTLLNGSLDILTSVGLVVFDEFHLIGETKDGDNSRSLTSMFAMLEIFEKLPDVDFVFLSAMVKNGNEIAEWLKTVTHRECLLFDDHWKPTRQLQGCLLYNEEDIKRLKKNIKKNLDKLPKRRLAASLNIQPYCLFSLKTIWDDRDVGNYCKVKLLNHEVQLALGSKRLQLTTNRYKVASEIASSFAKSNLRVMLFVDSPKNALSVQKNVNDILGKKDNKEFLEKESLLVSQIIEELGDFSYSYLLQQTSCIAHHGLLLPEERYLLEKLYCEDFGKKVIVATPTLAQGVNLPADIVIIAGYDRYDENHQERKNIEAHEILNAAGRAGRAGHNSYGAVILIPNHVLGFKDNTIGKEWFQLQESVFSQGDQCFEVKDPIENMVNEMLLTSHAQSIGEEILLYRLGSDEGLAKKKLARTLAAYHRQKRKQEPMEDFASQLISVSKTKTHDAFLQEMSVKFGINADKLLFVKQWVDEWDISVFMDKTAIENVEFFFEFMSGKEDVFEALLSNATVLRRIFDILKLEAIHLDSDALAKIKNLTVAYMEGCTMRELSVMMHTPKGSQHLENARKFVLSVIPAISYVFGMLVWILKKKADVENISLDGDILCLATILKEGVRNAAMLKFKEAHSLMRVACHKKYNK